MRYRITVEGPVNGATPLVGSRCALVYGHEALTALAEAAAAVQARDAVVRATLPLTNPTATIVDVLELD